MEYPKILYAIGDEIEWEGRKLATLVVEDVKAEEAAIARGWKRVEELLSAKAEEAVDAVKKAVRRK